MKTFIVEYRIIGVSLPQIQMVKAGCKEEAQSMVKRLFPNCSTASAKEA